MAKPGDVIPLPVARGFRAEGEQPLGLGDVALDALAVGQVHAMDVELPLEGLGRFGALPAARCGGWPGSGAGCRGSGRRPPRRGAPRRRPRGSDAAGPSASAGPRPDRDGSRPARRPASARCRRPARVANRNGPRASGPAPSADRRERLGDPCAELPGRRDLPRPDLAEDRGEVRAVARRHAGQEEIQGGAQAVDVGGGPDLVGPSGGLFGAHVVGGAQGRARQCRVIDTAPARIIGDCRLDPDHRLAAEGLIGRPLPAEEAVQAARRECPAPCPWPAPSPPRVSRRTPRAGCSPASGRDGGSCGCARSR